MLWKRGGVSCFLLQLGLVIGARVGIVVAQRSENLWYQVERRSSKCIFSASFSIKRSTPALLPFECAVEFPEAIDISNGEVYVLSTSCLSRLVYPERTAECAGVCM
jgi:hypothetical protein